MKRLYFWCLQTHRGGGVVSRPAAAPPADLSGQTNHQQRDGAGEDEESRANDATAEPCGGEMSDPVESNGRRGDRTHYRSSRRVCSYDLVRHCVAERRREEERWTKTEQEPPAEAGEHC